MNTAHRIDCAEAARVESADRSHHEALEIPVENAHFMPTSGLDPTGKVFQWNNHVYRGIYAASADFYHELFNGPLGDELIKAGLIDTRISTMQMKGYDLLFQQPLVPVISYASEWSSDMLKDAAKLTCNLEETLRSGGYTLRDGHPWNILFDRCKPVFVDIGSFIKEQPSGKSPFFLYDFRATFLYPLLLNDSGLSDVSHSMMVSFLSTDARGKFDFPVFRLLFGCISFPKWVFHWRRNKQVNRIWPRDAAKGLRLLKDQIAAIETGTASGTPSARNADTAGKRQTNDAKLTLQKVLHEALSKLKPATVLDIGAGSGWATQIALENGSRVISADIDDAKVTRLYRHYQQKGGDVYPVRMDFCSPNLDHGPWAICSAATDRFRSQMVLLLNLTDSLVQFRFLSFDRIASSLAHFSEKWALVEFVGAEHPRIRESRWQRLKSMNYTIDNFHSSLKRYFSKAEVFAEIEPNRWLLLCQEPRITSGQD